MDKIIEIKNLTVWYERNVNVLEDINISFRTGRIYALLGANGSGKSTLINVLCGVHSRFTGMVNMDGITIADSAQVKDINESKYKRFYISDTPMALDEMTSTQYIKFLLDSYNVKWHRERFDDLVQLFQFEKYPFYKIKHLSLGNKQKVSIIAAFMIDPPILILDEPLNGLDLKSVDVFLGMLREYVSKNRLVIISSHLVDIVEKWCDEVYYIKNKKIGDSIIISPSTNLRKELSL
ncbi:ATP-binding cassette domain-containing protein [Bacillus thermotolerans]|uniref:ATP-binding cassette domain-containing protein n=1 Tax=Bacillus thermotolerans TaxID=1221996 RepID=UPI00057FF3D4|nr:ABC transporter ATP-binding protein [Bacillus thermotolerans]KKB36127.1 ABC transporter, ATP-binding protein [Bacillus thermotolerans]